MLNLIYIIEKLIIYNSYNIYLYIYIYIYIYFYIYIYRNYCFYDILNMFMKNPDYVTI